MTQTGVRAHVLVYGRVQGVFFRSETYALARSLGVVGWVRNLPDGRVEAVFEGEEEKVREMIEFCRRGPRGARVTKLEISWEDPKNEDVSFKIR
ncbi:MAG: acylphosphatase [Candidatus Bathyarchaeia archaeon]